MAGSIATAVLSYPLYILMSTGFAGGLLALFIAGVLIGVIGGPMPSFVSERFPTRHRGAGVAISSAVSSAIFGGSAPYIITWILKVTGDPRAAAHYTTLCGVISAVSLVVLGLASRGRPSDHLKPLED